MLLLLQLLTKNTGSCRRYRLRLKKPRIRGVLADSTGTEETGRRGGWDGRRSEKAGWGLGRYEGSETGGGD